MSLESLSVRYGVNCELGEVLFSYYLKEHDKDKGRFKLITRVGRAPIVTCLRTNDHVWKDKFIFVGGDLVWGPRGPGGVSGHWKATSKKKCSSSCMLTDTNVFYLCRPGLQQGAAEWADCRGTDTTAAGHCRGRARLQGFPVQREFESEPAVGFRRRKARYSCSPC